MALFGKKKSDDTAEAPAEDAQQPVADPAKAAPFFDRAGTVHETSNYEYAVTLWLQGLARDPTSVPGLEGLADSAQALIATRNKFGPTKDQEKAARDIKAPAPVRRLILALLNWSTRPLDVSAGLKALEAAGKIPGVDTAKCAYWIGQRVLSAAARDPKIKKDALVRMMNVLKDAGAFDLAVRAGEAALGLDPSDRQLDAEVRNLSAQATMSTGGYEHTGEEGGFRANIRDAEAQRALEEQDRIVKTEDVVERVVANAKADYESRPDDPAAIRKYARALLERGTPADEKTAHDLLIGAYERTKEYAFRQAAGDIKLRQARRKLALLRAAAESGDAQAKDQFAKAARAVLKMEAEEYADRVKNYPTDLALKFELGKRYFELGRLEDAIEMFQAARREPKRRAECLAYLGEAFLRLGWQTEAIDTLREALAAHPNEQDEIGRGLRYALMSALEGQARESRDLAAAEEAAKIASGIAVEQLSFRDIREKRTVLQGLVKELRAESAA